MPFAIDRREKMFTAANLNNLYGRFDQKCRRVLDNKSPLFSASPDGVWVGKYPYGVWYVFRNDPTNCKRLIDDGATPLPYIAGIGYNWRNNHDQTKAAFELSKLESQHLDVDGGQVYVDRYPEPEDGFSCDVGAIHFSFELHRRVIDGVSYDVHLGWDQPGSGPASYVRGSLGPVDPTLPPGRIHKHRLAVAEIALEGIYEFRIFRSYQRFDCWRVHNCGNKTAVVYLQNPDGSSDRQFIAPGACRAFRRKPDGTWAYRFPGGDLCRYFFPYFTGDIPFFAEGPASWSPQSTQSPFLALESSATANNVANPFILFEWRKVMGAVHDPFIPYDIRQVYSGIYDDPTNANTLIGDAVFTWGRALVTWSGPGNVEFDREIRTFSGTGSLIDGLKSLGMEVVQNAGSLTLTSERGIIRISPVDANIFTTSSSPYWEIDASGTTISTIYPAQCSTGVSSQTLFPSVWQAGNEPTIFDSMRTLRRKVAVEVGFLNNYTDAVDIPEEKVGIVTLTPLGLMVRASGATGIGGQLLNNVETIADNQTLWIGDRPVGFGVGAWENFRFTSGTFVYYLQQRNALNAQWANIMPAMAFSQGKQAVNCAFVPPGGPWGFSSSVYDFEVQRIYQIDPTVTPSWLPYGGDFWVNKWGGANGVDASVRIPGSPNQTTQYATIPDPNNGAFVDFVVAGLDDIFKDRNRPSMASTVPMPGASPTQSSDLMTEIRWTGYTEHIFNLPYVPGQTYSPPGGGPFFHKVPKSAWLWNLLEWSVRSWTRAVPLCLGQNVCPLRDASGSAAVLGVLTVGSLLQFGTGTESGGTIPSYYVSEAGHDLLIANGIVAYRDTDVNGDPYWYVPALALATYCDSQGFTAWNFDAENGEPYNPVYTPSTAYTPLRNYGDGERRQSSSYYDVIAGKQRDEWIRYVDLRLPNELAS